MKKILSLCLLFIFLFVNNSSVLAEEKEKVDYNKLGIDFQKGRLANIQQQIILNQTYITELNNKTSYLSKEVQKLDDYILETQNKVDILNLEIEAEDNQLDLINNTKKEKIENCLEIKNKYEEIKNKYIGNFNTTDDNWLTTSSLKEIKKKTKSLASLSEKYTVALKKQNNSLNQLISSEQLSNIASSSKKKEREALQKEQDILSQQQNKKLELIEQYYADASTADALNDDLEMVSQEVSSIIKKLQSLGYSNSSNLKVGKGVLSYPCRAGKLTSDYGSRIHPISGKRKIHTGIDIGGNPVGTPVLAAADGIVITASWLSGYGYTVIIDHGNKISTLYGHNSKLSVKVGDVVSRGEKIAEVGSTGNSTGPHIHFEVRVNGDHTDPKQWL